MPSTHVRGVCGDTRSREVFNPRFGKHKPVLDYGQLLDSAHKSEVRSSCLKSWYRLDWTSLNVGCTAYGLEEHQQLLMQEYLIVGHGRWRSENAKDGFVKDKLEDRPTRGVIIRLVLYVLVITTP